MNSEVSGGVRMILRLEGLAVLAATMIMYGKSGFAFTHLGRIGRARATAAMEVSA
jgi:hypothetical protein